jgi:hypothetical protein
LRDYSNETAPETCICAPDSIFSTLKDTRAIDGVDPILNEGKTPWAMSEELLIVWESTLAEWRQNFTVRSSPGPVSFPVSFCEHHPVREFLYDIIFSVQA